LATFLGPGHAKEKPMKYAVAVTIVALLATAAYAQAPTSTCKVQSTEKKLAGAAEKSFMTKCQKDAATVCEKSAAEKKLVGAAKKSHLDKCVKDAVGA
jgi:hypothetical protein